MPFNLSHILILSYHPQSYIYIPRPKISRTDYNTYSIIKQKESLFISLLLKLCSFPPEIKQDSRKRKGTFDFVVDPSLDKHSSTNPTEDKASIEGKRLRPRLPREEVSFVLLLKSPRDSSTHHFSSRAWLLLNSSDSHSPILLLSMDPSPLGFPSAFRETYR